MRVDIEEINKLIDRLAEINKIPFMDIEWYENGVPHPLANEIESRKEFDFTGLNNTDYARIEFWHGEFIYRNNKESQ